MIKHVRNGTETRHLEGYQCSKTRECPNNKCIFRLRDVFGHPVFGSPCGPNPVSDDALLKAGVKADEIIWNPKLHISAGTNVIYIDCFDGILDGEE